MSDTLPPRRLGLLLALFAIGACANEPPAGSLPSGGLPPVDYHHDAAAVLERYCTTCHTEGGIGPLALTDYASAKRYAGAIKGAVQSERMPPWLPGDGSMQLRYSRKMRPQDRELLLRWLDTGLAEGDPASGRRTDIPPAETVAAPRADLVADPGRVYQPDNSRSDDYHCFVFDPKLAADTFMQAATVVPGNRAIVHHVLLFEVLAGDADEIRRLDAGGQGYPCFGGPGGSGRPTTLLGWAPGGVPLRVPEGTALRIHQGSLLVMQVHYNTLAKNGQGDRSVVQLELSATPPLHELRVVPIANPKQLRIPAGDPSAKQLITAPVSLIESFMQMPIGDLTIYANAPHMHLLGTRIVTSIGDKTLVEIPRWDFHWQQAYTLQTPVTVHSNDTIQVECTYDNRQTNQPVIGGVQQPSRDVTWGEGTLDEMCLSFLTVTPKL